MPQGSSTKKNVYYLNAFAWLKNKIYCDTNSGVCQNESLECFEYNLPKMIWTLVSAAKILHFIAKRVVYPRVYCSINQRLWDNDH